MRAIRNSQCERETKSLQNFDVSIQNAHTRVLFDRCSFYSGVGGGGTVFENCDFGICNFKSLYHTTFQQCRFNNLYFPNRPKLERVAFNRCIFTISSFENAFMAVTEFQGCDFQMCVFSHSTKIHDCRFIDCEFGFGPYSSGNKNLHSVQIDLEDISLESFNSDIINSRMNPIERHVSWERLRTFGRLPLFGVSLSALVAIPLATYLIALYNRQVLHLQAWAADDLGSSREYELSFKAMAAHLQQVALPSLTLWLLISTLLLGIASTIYSLFCPPRVKEFSLERWTDELGRSALHYLPLAWSRRPLRIIAGTAYLIGGLGTVAILSVKLFNSGRFIIENNALPWWMW